MKFIVSGQYIIDWTIELDGESYDVIEADIEDLMDENVALASATDQGFTIDHIEVQGAIYLVWYENDIDAEFHTKREALDYMNSHEPKHRSRMYLQEIFNG